MDTDTIYEYEMIASSDDMAWNLYRGLRYSRGHEEALEGALEYHLTMMGLNWRRPEEYWACERSSARAERNAFRNCESCGEVFG